MPTALFGIACTADTQEEESRPALQLEASNPSAQTLWINPDVQASITAAEMLRRGAGDAGFRASCLENTDGCLTQAGLTVPDGYSISLAESDDGQDAATIMDPDGTSTSFGLDRPPADDVQAEAANESGMTERGCQQYYVDIFVALCWDAYAAYRTPFKQTCLNDNACYCSPQNQNFFPCNYVACRDMGGSCDPSK